jgi:hypothetical protein
MLLQLLLIGTWDYCHHSCTRGNHHQLLRTHL